MSDDPTPPPIVDPLSFTTTEASTPQVVREDDDSPQLRARKRFREIASQQRRKKAEFVDSIMLNLDLLVYVEICILYYMEYVPIFPSISLLSISPYLECNTDISQQFLLPTPPPHPGPINVPNT